jgi:hypothetical protein
MMAAQSRTTAIAASPAWMIMPHLGEATDSSGCIGCPEIQFAYSPVRDAM